MRCRVVAMVVTAVTVAALAGCGSGDGSGPSITATLPPGDSLPVSQPAPVDTDAAAPPETQPPATQPPETQPPETQPPEEPAASAAPPDTVPAEEDGGDEGDDEMVWWRWVLAAVIIIGAAIALFGRRRSGPTWQVRVTALLDQTDQLTSHLAALDLNGLRAVAAADASAFAAMRGALRDLVATAPGAEQQAVLDRLSGPMAQLHGAVDAVALTAGPAVPPSAASVAQLAASLHTTSASVRADAAMSR